ncbi:SET domain-containing protein [Exidia glandulosa HHB12029]|uniref:SET domain-containing protein n=1 Tax=Exidia glandulosa HHB12029 TaxID=1314781 RepID=A0A166B4P8_EXIGL|nr:SET domain-containing protein [Exidia glandulosa HHB12029]
MKAWCSKDPDLRDVFLSIIQQNTLNDEPDAAAITISNTVDDDPCPPWEFAYTNRVLYGHGVRRGDKSKLQGCGCVGGCSATSASCACLHRQRRFFQLGGNDFEDYGFNYNADGQVLDYRFPVFECNDECGCDPETCLNRVTQRGRRYDIEIIKTPRKGWGVFAKSDIPMHSFVGVYSGELITDKESHLRSDFYDRFGRNYMFTLDMWYLKKKARRKYHKMFGAAGQSFQQFLEDEDKQPGDEEVDQNPSFTVDAFHAGNFTRFLNHCCDPNCVIVAVHIDEPHIRKPHLCIFTRRAVACDEELTFSYFGIDVRARPSLGDVWLIGSHAGRREANEQAARIFHRGR